MKYLQMEHDFFSKACYNKETCFCVGGMIDMPQKEHTSKQLPLNLVIEKKSQTRFFLIFGLFLICINSLLLKPLSIFFNNDVLHILSHVMIPKKKWSHLK